MKLSHYKEYTDNRLIKNHKELIDRIFDREEEDNRDFYINQIAEEICKFLPYFGYEILGGGNNRVGVLTPDKKYVIKFPINEQGLLDNSTEYRVYITRSDVEENIYAQCKLIDYLLYMEYVEIDFDRSILKNHSWVSFIDCRQVGINRDGNLVAYDYA